MTKHDTMRLRWVAAVVVASACAIVPAAATPPVGLTFELLAGPIVFAPWDVNVSPIDKNVKWDMKLSSRSDSDIYIVRNTVAPGGNLGWHTHPGPTMVSVIEGAVLLYDGTDPLCASGDTRRARASLRSAASMCTTCATPPAKRRRG